MTGRAGFRIGLINDEAGRRGDSRGVYKVVKMFQGKGSKGRGSLEGADPSVWVGHWKELLGTPKPSAEKSGKELSEKRAW